MRSTHQLALIDHRRDDEFWATKDLAVEVIASKFPRTIGGGWNCHYGIKLLESAFAQNAREEADEGTYFLLGNQAQVQSIVRDNLSDCKRFKLRIEGYTIVTTYYFKLSRRAAGDCSPSSLCARALLFN